MNWHATIGILAGVVQVASVIPYVRDMLKGRTRPNMVTWLLWTILQIIVIFAQFSAGASWSVIILIVMTFNTVLVTILCLKGYGYKKYGILDYSCFFLALVTIVVWRITEDPILAIILAVAIDFLAMIPTIVKAYRDPHSEAPFPWFLNVVAGALAALSTTKIDVANLIFPIYYIITDGFVVILILRGRRALLESK